MWTHKIGRVTIQCGPTLHKTCHNWQAWPWGHKLKTAVDMAPTMVTDAINALNGHLARSDSFKDVRKYQAARDNLQGQLKNDSSVGMVDHSEVGQGLVKYFNLEHSHANYWSLVLAIRRVFEKIQGGLHGPYTLKLDTMNDRGRVVGVPQWETVPVSPIRADFGFTKEWGDRDYHPLRQGDIEINAEWVREALETSFVARTIVHEASHKWAFTKDILYKHNRSTDASVKRVTFPERGDKKVLLLMAGLVEEVEQTETGQRVVAERLLENADSYAWFARRMSKRWGSFQKKNN